MDYRREKTRFTSANLNGQWLRPSNPVAGALVLNGWSSSLKKKDYISEALAEAGHLVFSFDQAGHGKSPGATTDSTLRGWDKNGRAAYDLFSEVPCSVVVGTSMGGFAAARLALEVAVQKLVLIVPAAYAESILDIPLTEELRERNRSEHLYATSPLFPGLKDFKGETLLIYGSEEEVIPPQAQDLYTASFSPARLKRITLDGAPHMVRAWAEEEPETRLKPLQKLIVDFALR